VQLPVAEHKGQPPPPAPEPKSQKKTCKSLKLGRTITKPLAGFFFGFWGRNNKKASPIGRTDWAGVGKGGG
jgi:hypothetical protein